MCGCFSPRDESHRMIIAKSRSRLIAKGFHSSGDTFRRLFTAPVARLLQGGRVAISTANAQALDAIHQFLRFQVSEHQTGDSLTLE
jgi:hypothetical protein